MALYPAIFVLYLGKFIPALTAGWRGYVWSLAVVVLCCAWNLRGAPPSAKAPSGSLFCLLAPFAVFVVLGLWHGLTLHPAMHWGRIAGGPGAQAALSTAILVAMWNYMGWDNASTVAQRSRESPAQLSARHDRRRRPHRRHLRSSARGHGPGRPLARRASPPVVGHRRPRNRRSHRWLRPSSPAASSAASACSTR